MFLEYKICIFRQILPLFSFLQNFFTLEYTSCIPRIQEPAIAAQQKKAPLAS